MKNWLLLLAAVLCACTRTPADLQMHAREWRVWNLPPDGATLPTPRSVAVGNDGEIATLDTAGRVLIYDGEGALKRQWQMLDVSVGKPEGIVVLRDGRVVVCDTHYHRVVWFDAGGGWVLRASAQIPLSDSSLYGRQDEKVVLNIGVTRLIKRD